MNLQQLEYIAAVDKHCHFGKAASACFVTQPTLSAMVQKLEEELGVLIFDRSVQPVVTTEQGKEIVAHAKLVLAQVNLLRETAAASKGLVQGELNVAVIPTVAIYLLPALLQLAKDFPLVKLNVREMTTDNILEKLRSGEIDTGILATPLHQPDINEEELYLEPLKVFVANEEKPKTQYLLPQELDPAKIWMLEEGHCLSKQFIQYCKLQHNTHPALNVSFQTGSLETLLHLVEASKGITIVPMLAAEILDAKRQSYLHDFKPPIPVRQISLVSYRPLVKAQLNKVLKESVQHYIQPMLSFFINQTVAIEILPAK